MAIKEQQLARVFKWNSVELKDPNPSFTVNQVRDFFAISYPGITTAEIGEPTSKGGKLIFEFIKAVGAKG